MKTCATDVLVVGAGPAGLAAAAAAASGFGARVTIVDESPVPGGQLWRHRPGRTGHLPRVARTLLGALSDPRVELRTLHSVWGGEPGCVLVEEPSGAALAVEAGAVVIATGAREIAVPFPGWTLPGVLAAGAVQSLVKGSGVAPGRRVLVAGGGPFLLAVAADLVHAGVEVAGVVDAGDWRVWLRAVPALWHAPERALDAFALRETLRRARVPLHRGELVVAADGDGRVERVTTCRVAGDWRPREHTAARDWDVDVLAVAWGFQPNVELAQLLGCATDEAGLAKSVRFDPATMRSSLANVFVAGEVAGVGGGPLAVAEGRIAGAAAARASGAPAAARASASLRAAFKRRRLASFAAGLAPLLCPGEGAWSLARADTVVCRCEEVPLDELDAAVAVAGGSRRALKAHCRAGMGVCQGRTCEPAIRARLGEAPGGSPDEASDAGDREPAPRAPLRPVSLAAWAELTEEEPCST